MVHMSKTAYFLLCYTLISAVFLTGHTSITVSLMSLEDRLFIFNNHLSFSC